MWAPLAPAEQFESSFGDLRGNGQASVIHEVGNVRVDDPECLAEVCRGWWIVDRQEWSQ
jgi:hypothetical protein